MSLFPEEQLDSPVGYFPVQPDHTLKDHDGQWTIIRKLGWGPRSSTWLACHNEFRHYKAIKILTVEATEDLTGKNERDILLGIKNTDNPGLPRIQSSFYEHDSKGKRHLCLVLEILGSSVEDLRLSNVYDGEYLALHVVQKVIGDISCRLSSLADKKIIHGAVTADNFLFLTAQSDTYGDIRKILAKSPSNRAEKIRGSDGVTYPSVRSQPFPHSYRWDSREEDIIHTEIYLSNYAHARSTAGTTTLHSPKNFLPPEALQDGVMNLKSDIWMLGCTTYLLLTGGPLFSDSYIASPVNTATEILGKLESLLSESEKISEQDIPSTASFLRSCLAIKPNRRPNAEEIFDGGWIKKHGLWIKGHTGCSCGWPCESRRPPI